MGPGPSIEHLGCGGGRDSRVTSPETISMGGLGRALGGCQRVNLGSVLSGPGAQGWGASEVRVEGIGDGESLSIDVVQTGGVLWFLLSLAFSGPAPKMNGDPSHSQAASVGGALREGLRELCVPVSLCVCMHVKEGGRERER